MEKQDRVSQVLPEGEAWSSPEGLEGFLQVENREGLTGGGESPGRERE